MFAKRRKGKRARNDAHNSRGRYYFQVKESILSQQKTNKICEQSMGLNRFELRQAVCDLEGHCLKNNGGGEVIKDIRRYGWSGCVVLRDRKKGAWILDVDSDRVSGIFGQETGCDGLRDFASELLYAGFVINRGAFGFDRIKFKAFLPDKSETLDTLERIRIDLIKERNRKGGLLARFEAVSDYIADRLCNDGSMPERPFPTQDAMSGPRI